MPRPQAVIKGYLSYNVWVECPVCHDDFDVVDQDDEGYMARELFNNKWSDLEMELTCPKCQQPILMNDVEY